MDCATVTGKFSLGFLGPNHPPTGASLKLLGFMAQHPVSASRQFAGSRDESEPQCVIIKATANSSSHNNYAVKNLRTRPL
jgi:hypothetical protein